MIHAAHLDPVGAPFHGPKASDMLCLHPAINYISRHVLSKNIGKMKSQVSDVQILTDGVGGSRASLFLPLSSLDSAATFLLLRRQIPRAREIETTDMADATAVAVAVLILPLFIMVFLVFMKRR